MSVSAFVRAYRNRQHAEQFATEGRIRLSHVLEYRTGGESTKVDSLECEAQFQVPGQIPRVAFDINTAVVRPLCSTPGYFHFSGTWCNPIYLFCGSELHVDPEHQKRALGDHVVEVFNAPLFLDRLRAELERTPVRGHQLSFVDLYRVSYDKGGVRNEESARDVAAYVATKSPRFQADREVRIVAMYFGPAGPADRHLYVQVPGPSDYCRMSVGR